MILLSAFALIFYSFAFFTSGIENNECLTLETWFFLMRKFAVADSLLTLLVPLIIIFAMNLLIIVKLMKCLSNKNLNSEAYWSCSMRGAKFKPSLSSLKNSTLNTTLTATNNSFRNISRDSTQQNISFLKYFKRNKQTNSSVSSNSKLSEIKRYITFDRRSNSFNFKTCETSITIPNKKSKNKNYSYRINFVEESNSSGNECDYKNKNLHGLVNENLVEKLSTTNVNLNGNFNRLNKSIVASKNDKIFSFKNKTKNCKLHNCNCFTKCKCRSDFIRLNTKSFVKNDSENNVFSLSQNEVSFSSHDTSSRSISNGNKIRDFGCNGLSKKRGNRYTKTTKMLLIVSSCFFILNCPIALNKMWYFIKHLINTPSNHINNNNNLHHIEHNFGSNGTKFSNNSFNLNGTNTRNLDLDTIMIEEIFERITCSLYYINFISNFLLYSLYGSKFRLKLLNLFRFNFKKLKKRNRYSFNKNLSEFVD